MKRTNATRESRRTTPRSIASKEVNKTGPPITCLAVTVKETHSGGGGSGSSGGETTASSFILCADPSESVTKRSREYVARKPMKKKSERKIKPTVMKPSESEAEAGVDLEAKVERPPKTVSPVSNSDSGRRRSIPKGTSKRHPGENVISILRGGGFVRKSSKEVDFKGGDPAVFDNDILKKNTELIVLYFSAKFCPPCRAFTPKLNAFHDNIFKADEKAPISFVFVSSDPTESEFQKYFSKMHWSYALAYDDVLTKRCLSDLLGVTGIPTLVVIDRQGRVVERNAKSDVTRDPAGALAAWQARAATLSSI